MCEGWRGQLVSVCVSVNVHESQIKKEK